jgi:spore cortex protein
MSSAVLSLLMLSACGTNNNNSNDTARGNQANNELRNANYNPDSFNGFTDQGTINPIVNNTTDNVFYNSDQNNNRITVADTAAKKIVEMREVDQANVLVTDNQAYVAAQLEDNAGKQLEKNVEKQISDIVKSTDQNIDTVYISVNPDFYNRTTTYANDIRNGRPIEGLFEEFTTLIHRVFPTRK